MDLRIVGVRMYLFNIQYYFESLFIKKKTTGRNGIIHI